MLPDRWQSWGWAIRHEAAAIPDDTRALLFALHGLAGLAPRALTVRLLQPLAASRGDGTALSGEPIIMTVLSGLARRPRALGTACAMGAVLLGLSYLALAGAPGRYLIINASALVIGFALLALVGGGSVPRWTAGATIAAASGLLATAMLGAAVDGAARWVSLGGLSIQPSLVLLPVMITAFARDRSLAATLAIIAAAAAMALQPDRGAAGMLVLGLIPVAALSRDRHATLALTAGVVGFAATLVRADALPAVPYVDQILHTAFDVHIAAGVAVVGGAVLLLLPAVVGWRGAADDRAIFAALGAVWLAAIGAAALGNYPTPVVGYGGSAIIGYVLSLAALPARISSGAAAAETGPDQPPLTGPDRQLRLELA